MDCFDNAAKNRMNDILVGYSRMDIVALCMQILKKILLWLISKYIGSYELIYFVI
jgi:septum formation topological specificity factor MinE